MISSLLLWLWLWPLLPILAVGQELREWRERVARRRRFMRHIFAVPEPGPNGVFYPGIDALDMDDYDE